MPTRLPDGKWEHVRCGYELVPGRTWELLKAFQDSGRGMTPVSLGMAKWLPRPWLLAMREARTLFEEADRKRQPKG